MRSFRLYMISFLPLVVECFRAIQSSTSSGSFTLIPSSLSRNGTPTTLYAIRPPMLSFAKHYSDQPRLFFASVLREASQSATKTSTDPVMREFQVKEAVIQKQHERAAAQLAEHEITLKNVQAKKQEYIAASQLQDCPVGGSVSETALRSAVKALCWRILAGSITFMTTLKFSGSLSQALKVVGADFFSKAFTMFLGERLMNKSQAGRKKGGDEVGRSLAKALIWRLFAVANTLTMAVFISSDLSIASKIASADAIFKTSLMFFYERVWAKIGWGEECLIEFST